jgi:hypothetical protein
MRMELRQWKKERQGHKQMRSSSTIQEEGFELVEK